MKALVFGLCLFLGSQSFAVDLICKSDLSSLSDDVVIALSQTLKLGKCRIVKDAYYEKFSIQVFVTDNGYESIVYPNGGSALDKKSVATLLREYVAAGVCD